jgi:hypothetical protein
MKTYCTMCGGAKVIHLVNNMYWHILNSFVLMCYSDYTYHFSARCHAANVILNPDLLIYLLT